MGTNSDRAARSRYFEEKDSVPPVLKQTGQFHQALEVLLDEEFIQPATGFQYIHFVPHNVGSTFTNVYRQQNFKQNYCQERLPIPTNRRLFQPVF